MTTNLMEALRAAVIATRPNVIATLDAPDDPKGTWFLDLVDEGHHVVVEWRPTAGFGVSSVVEHGFGEGPEEIYFEVEAATVRVLDLLRNRAQTDLLRGACLRDLRKDVARLTQEELATQLGIQQAAVSKLEQRTDTTVSTLRQVIEAMGGKLEIIARFPGENVVRITQFG